MAPSPAAQPLLAAQPAYTAKVDALLDHAASLGFTAHDFIALALASADQAGASIKAQARIADLLDRCQCDSCRPTVGDR